MTALRGTAVTARVGSWLGIAITVCFVTGLISHFIQHPQPWFFWPTRPVWLYRLTQGLHVISGIAAIPLLVVKLWSVWPKLFERPIIGGLTRQLERGVDSGAGGVDDLSAHHRPAEHRAVVCVQVLLHHQPLRDGLCRRRRGAGAHRGQAAGHPPGARRAARRTAPPGSGRSRRARCCAAPGWPSALATVVTAGQTVPWLRKVSVLAPRSGEGPQGVPINRVAIAAGVLRSARSPDYRLTVANGTDHAGVHRRRARGDAADHAPAADRLRRGLERQRRVDRGRAGRPGRRGRRRRRIPTSG